MKEKKTIINGNVYGVINAEDGSTINQDIHLPKHEIPKKLTPQTGLANDIDFVGRKKELKKVDELLNQNSMLLLLNGIGGIGKSTLASYYLNHKKDDFKYYGFIQVNENIKASFASAFSTSLDLKSEKIDDLFNEIMNKLQNLKGKKLLIIDDVKKMDTQLNEINTLITLKNSGFQILFTSRETKEYIPQYFLDIMSIEDARELFLKHYPTNEMDKVDKILKYLDYHTLFIEITAKTLKRRKRTLSLDKMIEKFVSGEFSSIKKNREESFNLFLSNLFKKNKILQDKNNILFLKKLSVLPSIEISFEDLYKFLVCEDEDRLEEFLIKLVDNGWLIESEHDYKFHQILKEFILANYMPSFEEIDEIIDFFYNLMGNPLDIQDVINNKKYFIYYTNLTKLADYLNFNDGKIGDFFNRFALVSKYIGKNEQVEKFYLKAIEIIKNDIRVDNKLNLASIYTNIAKFYQEIGEYIEAEEFYHEAYEIYQNFGEDNINTANFYNNIGVFYLSIKDFNKADFFLNRALKIKLFILGDKDILTSVAYNDLAVCYEFQQKYDKAEELHKEALKIRKLKNNNTELAISYGNLGRLYLIKNRHKKSEEFFLKALKIQEDTLTTEHKNTITTYNYLAFFYYKIKKYGNAIKYLDRVIFILDKNPQIDYSNSLLTEAYSLLNIIHKKINKPKRNNPCPCNSGKKYKKCCGK